MNILWKFPEVETGIDDVTLSSFKMCYICSSMQDFQLSISIIYVVKIYILKIAHLEINQSLEELKLIDVSNYKC